MQRILLLLFGLFCFSLVGLENQPPKKVSLHGPWSFQLDPEETGVKSEWYLRDLQETIQLPGVLQGQGFGNEITIDTPWTGDIVDRSWFTATQYAKYRNQDNIKIPFWLQPDRYYKGPAWYQRVIDLPEAWEGRRIVLTLERPHWGTTVWIDNQLIGTSNSLSTPHVYSLGTGLAPGPHRLSIRVDNRMLLDIGPNSHSISDHTQGNWNGIVGRIELETTPDVWIDGLQVFPNLNTRKLRALGKIGNESGQSGHGNLTIRVATIEDPKETLATKTLPVSWEGSGGQFDSFIDLPASIKTWDEFSPNLYRVSAILQNPLHSKTVTFGFRKLSTEGTQFVLNGRKIFFRGTLECAIFPATGHPPADVASWEKVIRAAQAHGLNHMRFHSWCPPEAAFQAADKLGFYFQVEAASWANGSSRLGDGLPVDTWIYEESDRILEAYGNHPSFLLFPYGNEPGGDHHKSFLAKWVNHYKSLDNRRLYSSASGWPEIEANEFHVSPNPRIQGWGQGLQSRINAKPPETVSDYKEYIATRSVPVISHEIGQWCVYPNFEEMEKYKGYLKPKNFEIFRETLEGHHMLSQAKDFLLASGKLQTLCYKEDIESALRTKGMGGFQLLDLHDFPGQGTALVGVLDPFWEPKGYVSPGEFRRFCNSTVPLARLKKRVFTTSETFEAQLEVAHFGPAPIENAVAEWSILDSKGNAIKSGQMVARELPIDNGIYLGRIGFSLNDWDSPQRYRLAVRIEETAIENDWDFWVYPSAVNPVPPKGILVSRHFDSKVQALLGKGGTALWLIKPEQVAGDEWGKVATGFSSIFWNTAWTNRQAPHTLGILCDPSHPALAQFPTEFHSNWQWWYLIHQSQAMILDQMPKGLQPVVQMIDDWFTNRKLGLVFEGRVGEGRIVVCSIDLLEGSTHDPVSRQLLHSLFEYMSSDSFQPQITLSVEQLKRLSVSHQS